MGGTMATHHGAREEKLQALDAYIKLMRAAHSTNNRIHRHLRSWRLTASQMGVLDAVHHLGPLSQQDLARKNLMSPGNTTTVVDNLEKRGLVQRHRQDGDRRLVKVHLTEKGTQLFVEAWPSHVKTIVEEMDSLSSEELAELGRLCQKLGLRQVGNPTDYP
jgi:MarR family transcriptional regulator, 2-MHQ and catechol-resistance regulon repressor